MSRTPASIESIGEGVVAADDGCDADGDRTPYGRAPIAPTLGRRAVVADDDEFFRLALNSILTRRLGFAEVMETASLDAALERLDQPGHATPVSLALFDLSMPGMASAGSLSAVRECHPAVKMVVVSASTARRDILQALEAGAHGYVPKQLGASELCRALDLILGGHIFVPPCLAEIGPAAARPAETNDPGAAPPSPASGPSTLLLDMLTPRQREVLTLLVEGRTNKDIARRLNLGEGTVKVHVAALLRGLGVQNRSAAAVAGALLVNQGGSLARPSRNVFR